MGPAKFVGRIGKPFRIWLIALMVPAYLASSRAISGEPTAPVIEPFSLYGTEIFFDVYREGERVGFHRTRFSTNGAELVVNSTFQLQIDVLFFTAFRYLYTSEGRWRHGQLESLKASVDDDGATSAVSAFKKGTQIKIKNVEGTVTVDAPLFPTNHWNAGVLSQSRVLNTLTGRVNDVRIVPRRREAVPTERGDVPATHHAYTGDLATEVWYDDAGRWVKMRFKARDGSTIDYVCRRCQGAAVEKAQR